MYLFKIVTAQLNTTQVGVTKVWFLHFTYKYPTQ